MSNVQLDCDLARAYDGRENAKGPKTKEQKEIRLMTALDKLALIVGGMANLSRILGISENTAYSWRKAGQISVRGFILALHSDLLPREFVLPLRPDLKHNICEYDSLRIEEIYEQEVQEMMHFRQLIETGEYTLPISIIGE